MSNQERGSIPGIGLLVHAMVLVTSSQKDLLACIVVYAFVSLFARLATGTMANYNILVGHAGTQ